MRRSTLNFISCVTVSMMLLAACDSANKTGLSTSATRLNTGLTRNGPTASTPQVSGTNSTGRTASTPDVSGSESTGSSRVVGGSYKPDAGSAPSVQTGFTNKSIVGQVKVDRSGNEITAKTLTSAASPMGNGKAKCSKMTIGVLGPLTGPTSAFGATVLSSAQLAVLEHNKANPDCQIKISKVNAASNTTDSASKLISDSSVVAVLGPVTTDEVIASGADLSRAGLLSISPSATTAALTTKGWKSFFRGVASDDLEAPAVGSYLVKVKSLLKVCVVSASSSYGQSLAIKMRAALAGSYDGQCSMAVKPGQTDFAPAARTIKAESPDGIFYAGYYPDAARFLQQVRKSGITASFIGSDGINVQAFVDTAGVASAGATIACPCVSAPAAFGKFYRLATGNSAGAYATEAYDLTTIIIKGIDTGQTTRSAMVKYAASYQGTGLAGNYAWDKNGNLNETTGIWISQVQ